MLACPRPGNSSSPWWQQPLVVETWGVWDYDINCQHPLGPHSHHGHGYLEYAMRSVSSQCHHPTECDHPWQTTLTKHLSDLHIISLFNWMQIWRPYHGWASWCVLGLLAWFLVYQYLRSSPLTGSCTDCLLQLNSNYNIWLLTVRLKYFRSSFNIVCKVIYLPIRNSG